MDKVEKDHLKDPSRDGGTKIGSVDEQSAAPSAIHNEGTTNKVSLDIQITERKKTEEEIKEILHINKETSKHTIAVTGTIKDNGDIDNLELGQSVKWRDQSFPGNDLIHGNKGKSNANVEHSASNIILSKGEFDLMKKKVDEQAKLIENMKKDFEERIEDLRSNQEISFGNYEEIRSLITSTTNANDMSDRNATQHGNTHQPARGMRASMFGRTSAVILGSHESISIDCDTFSLMMISPVRSRSWILGFASFSCQMTLGVMILIGQFKESDGSSIFGIPFKVNDLSVRVAQFLSILLCLSTQSDILSSIRSLLLLGIGSNWLLIIGEEERQASSCSLWIIRIGMPNIFKFSQGLVVTFASFVIIVQNKDTIDLLKDFTSLMVVSEFDNIFFHLASYGYLGEELHLQTAKITDEDQIRSISTTDRQRKNKFLFVRFTFLAILSAMFTGWGIIFNMQSQGQIFNTEFPGCGKEHYELAFEEFGNGKCYGGPFNTLKCKYEDGDCTNFNTAFPSCNGKYLTHLHNVEKEVGTGTCNMMFAIAQCDYDGGDCCPNNIHQSVLFGDGKCDGGLYNTEGCQYDFGDCDSFNSEYPNCTLDTAMLTSESSAGIILGDGICDGGAYNSEECGFEYGDCVKAQIGGNVVLSGVLSPVSNVIHFDMWMSADASKLLVKMPRTNQDTEKYDLNTDGKIAGYAFNSTTLKWVRSIRMDKKGLTFDGFEYMSMAVAGDGRVVAVGSPSYADGSTWTFDGRVTIFNFWGNRNHQILTGIEENALFGLQVDLTHDGTRIAVVSSPLSGSRSGKIEVFQKNKSEELWTQVGNEILGKDDHDRIGFYYVGLNSSDGTRVYFSAGLQLRIYKFDSPSQEWVELATDTPILLRPYHRQKDLITISADGNRFALSSYTHDTASESQGKVTIYDWIQDSSFPNEGSWNLLGPPISSPSNENGFGHSISMDADGTLLAISAVDPECDGRSRYEENENYNLLEGASTALCATGSIELYQFKPTNPSWRPFTQLPQIRDINSQIIMETQQQVKENMILGLQVSLSGDGSVLTVSGFDIDGDFGFVKVYNVTDLFYVDCLAHDLGEIGNGRCNSREPYYTEECGYDGGGDCPLPSPVEGLEGCKVANPTLPLGNGFCYDRLPYNSEACNYDGGDCPLPSPVEGYPSCFVSYPEIIRDGFCDDFLPYSSYECGFDGGDCLPPGYAPTSSPSESIQPSAMPSTSHSTFPSTSVMPSPNPSNTPSSSPTLSKSPSMRPSISSEPSISAMPSTTNVVVKLELLTDVYPWETSWSLIDNSQDGAIVHSGPGDGKAYDADKAYDANSLYSVMWTLNRCTSYTFKISDYYGDGLISPGYIQLSIKRRQGEEKLERIDSNFGSERSISFNICDDEQASLIENNMF